MNSCDKDDDENVNNGGIGNTITATIENGDRLNGKIDSIKAVFDYEDENGDWREYIAASAPYINGGFTLNLPEIVDDVYLEKIDNWLGAIPEGITVSNHNVKMAHAALQAHKVNGYYSGDNNFYIGTGTSDDDDSGANYWFSTVIYSNGDVSITGYSIYREVDDGDHTDKYTLKYSIYLKKGWNRVYAKDLPENENHTYENEATTTTPPGAKWLYDDYNSPSLLSSKIQKSPFLSSKRK
jgi:hypothetical protein